MPHWNYLIFKVSFFFFFFTLFLGRSAGHRYLWSISSKDPGCRGRTSKWRLSLWINLQEPFTLILLSFLSLLQVHQSGSGWSPVVSRFKRLDLIFSEHWMNQVSWCLCPLQYVEDNLSVMSIGFLLSSPDDAVIWRGPKKNGIPVYFMCIHSVYSTQQSVVTRGFFFHVPQGWLNSSWGTLTGGSWTTWLWTHPLAPQMSTCQSSST